MSGNFTPSEKRIYDLLADGEGHSREQVLKAVDAEANIEEPSDLANMYVVISKLRGKLKMIGQDIVAQSFGRKILYRRVRHLVIRQD